MNEKQGTFDASRAVLEDYLDGSLYPARLMAADWEPLTAALAAGQLPPESHLLTFEYDRHLYAFPMSVVLSHNVIQGTTGHGAAWLMTFCNACNTGMVFDPTLDGRVLHFQRRGSYDGLLLIWDEESDSYWQHITGIGLYGASEGKQLRTLTTTRQMSAAEAAARRPDALLIVSQLTPEQQKLSRAMEKMRAYPEKVEGGIFATIMQEDTRRPRFELGLGVWKSISESSFFPLELLYRCDSVMLTEFDGRRLLIYQMPDAIAPVAVYLDAYSGYWDRDVLRLDTGGYIHNDLYIAPSGEQQTLERPMQLLMRWYGFALTFPGCHVPDSEENSPYA